MVARDAGGAHTARARRAHDVLARGRARGRHAADRAAARPASSAPATRSRSARSAPRGAPGSRCPADVSVVGYDDSAFMNCTDPPLTTVRQPIEAIGRAAVAMLTGQIEGAAVPAEELFFEPELVARGSTAAAPVELAPAPDVAAAAKRRLQRSRRTVDTAVDLSIICKISSTLAFDRRMCDLPPREAAGSTTTTGARSRRRRVRRRRRRALVARRRRLPGLRPELRGRERRRDRRPRRRARRGCRTCATSASTRSGSTPGTRRRWPTPATTSRTTASIDPAFGTLEQAEQLIAEARALGIRTIIDIVPNHVSDQHPWFRAALASPPGSPERERFWFRPGAGEHGELPPNGWQSIFGGSAWTRTSDATACPASGTSTCSRPSSPTSTGRTPTSGASTRTCCASGSTAASPACGSTRRRCSSRTRSSPRSSRRARPASTRSPTGTSCTTSTAAGARSPTATPSRACSSARSGCPTPSGFARYLRPDELHTAFNFDFLACPWEPGPMRTSIDVGARRARAGRRAGDLGALEPRRHAARHALRPRRHRRSRSSRSAPARRPISSAAPAAPAPPRCSRWRCPARCTSTRARSSACPRSRTSPPSAARTRCGSARAALDPGRDGCRVPLPWAGDRPPYGFSRDGRRPALARPARRLGAAHRRRAVRRTRRRCSRSTAPACACAAPTPWAGDGDAALAPAPPSRSSPSRAATASPASSTSARTRSSCRPAPTVLIASDELEGGALPQDTTVWLRQARARTPSRTRQHGSHQHRIGQGKGRTMKSTRMATTAAVAVASLLAVCASRDLERGRQSGSATRQRSRSASRR